MGPPQGRMRFSRKRSDSHFPGSEMIHALLTLEKLAGEVWAYEPC